MSFFKSLFASILGVIIGILLLFAVVIGVVITFSGDEVEISENSVLKIKLKAEIGEVAYEDPLQELGLPSGSGKAGLMEILSAIENAAVDDRIKGIYLNVEIVSAGFVTLTEIRNALIKFKESGKFIYSYADYMTEGAYYIASVADKIYLNPVGMLEFNGLVSERTFYKGMFDKFGIQPEIFKVGSFKSAVEPYLRKDMSEESRFQTKTYLDSLHNYYTRQVSKSRKVTYEELIALSDSMAVRTAQDAATYGLITEAGYYDQVETAIREALAIKEKKRIRFVSLAKYLKAEEVIAESTSRNRIAVIVGNGTIISGDGDYDNIGGNYLANQIKKAREDKRVKAIVLRINSPGGSALASDIMWREVMLTKGVKPIFASMSDVAASGGYYMAMACDTIVAMPNTITGSIGIFATLFEAEKLFNDELGITFDEVSTGEYANLGSPTDAFTDGERKIVQAMINEGYRNFTQKAADGRGMSREQLMEYAEGRVWVGAKAKEIGLVDVLGDFQTAIDLAAASAGLEEGDYKLKWFKPKKPELLGGLPFGEVSTNIKQKVIQEELGDLYQVYKDVQKLRHMKGIQALMPFDVVIH